MFYFYVIENVLNKIAIEYMLFAYVYVCKKSTIFLFISLCLRFISSTVCVSRRAWVHGIFVRKKKKKKNFSL